MQLSTHLGVFSPLATAYSVSSCILQAKRELEESTTRIVLVLLTRAALRAAPLWDFPGQDHAGSERNG